MRIHTARSISRRNSIAAALTLPVAMIALLIAGAPALLFAGGSDQGDSQTFGAYQVDFNTGPVGIKIRGESAAEVVTISEENIPKGVQVHYDEQGGILTVSVTGSVAGKPGAKPIPAGLLYTTMPRYEFVHISTSAGPVTIDNLSTEHLTVTTQSGDIHVTNTNAALKAQSTSGNQSYGQLYGALDATSTSGNVSVDNTWGVMNLKSQSGSLDGAAVALAGNSSFRTTTGAIKMGLAYSFYRDTFDLRSNGGTIRLGSLSGTGSLRWGHGSVQVIGVTGSGSQDYQ